MSTDRAKPDLAPTGRASATDLPESVDVLRGTAAGAETAVTVASPGFGASFVTATTANSSSSRAKPKKKNLNDNATPISDEDSSSHQS